MTCRARFLVLVVPFFCLGWLPVSHASAKEVLCEKNAAALSREGKLDEGIRVIRECLNQDSSRAKAHVVLGYLLLKKGDMKQAERSFSKALALRPRSSAAKIGKGIVLSRAGELEKAEALLQDGLKLNPDPTRAHYELGLLYEQLGDIQRALFHFKQGITAYEQGEAK